MKSNGRRPSRGRATGLSNGKRGSKAANSAPKNGSHKKPKVSAAAVKTHPVKKISSGMDIQPRTTRRTSTEPYKERVISGRALSRWRVMPSASQQHILKVLDNVISVVLNDTNDVVYKDVQTHLNQLKQRITTNLTSLKVPPVKDYQKLEEQCKLLEEILVETNNQSDSLDDEIEQIEELIEEKERRLTDLENEASDGENNDRRLHPALESTYVNQLGLPPLSNPACYFGGIKHVDGDVQAELLQSLSNTHASNSSQEISQYISTLLKQVGSLQ